MTLYRGMDAATLEREYSPSSMIGGNYMPFIDRYIELSAQARALPGVRQDLAYGSLPTQVLDFFPAPSPLPRGAPLHIFIHGGYWQELSHKESAAMAPAIVASGSAFATLNYTLAPHARLGEMVEECRAALAWLARNAVDLGIDATRVTLSGHSAGAHLAAMVLSAPGEPLRASGMQITQALLISGVFDLDPIRLTSVNDPLQLTSEEVTALSPQQLQPDADVHFRIVAGQYDTAEFIRQSRDYAAHLSRLGHRVSCDILPDLNHFDIILQPALFA